LKKNAYPYVQDLFLSVVCLNCLMKLCAMCQMYRQTQGYLQSIHSPLMCMPMNGGVIVHN